MAVQAKLVTEIAGASEVRGAQKGKRKAREEAEVRIEAIGNKKFDSMTRAEKDELLFRLCLDAGILPKGTE